MNKKGLSVVLGASVILALSAMGGCGGTSAMSGPPSTLAPTGPTTTFTDTASGTSGNGLTIDLSIDSTVYTSGEQISVSIEEKNTKAQDNNVAVANLWPIQGLLDGPTGVVNYPFGVAILKGYYDTTDIASTPLLTLYDPTATYNGPMVLANITSYDFQPASDTAAVYQNNGASPALSISMTASVTATGSWSWIGDTAPVLGNFAPGTYTVVGGNEWGAVVVLHFTVS